MNQDTVDNRPQLLRDIDTNYQESFQFLRERKRRQVNQLILMNNLQRGDENIASTLLLTLFNRMLSNLYDDKMQIKFLPTQGITQNQLNSYNMLAKSDYLEMNKAKLDYDWTWDTLFFGRGYVETLRFNKKKKIMEPHVINPLVFGYDPYFEEIQQWRYYWKWISKSKWEIKGLIKDGTITGITAPDEIESGIDPYLYDYKLRRDRAKKAIEPSMSPMADDVYQILEYYGYDDDGDKCVYWVDKGISKILMQKKLDLKDAEDGKGSKWPIVMKEAFREPHASVNFSVADLLEDKHRAKSVLLNLAFIAAKDHANPLYGYNPDKVRDVSQFFSRQINQHIPMDDESAAWVLNTKQPLDASLTQFIQVLTAEAQDPTGSGQPTHQPGQGKSSTATQVAIETQLNQMAFSLQSKIMQFGEQEFWSSWFHRYALHADDLDSKIANIVGVKGVTSTEVFFKDFNTDYPPGVLVYSAKEAESEELVLRNTLTQIYPELAQTLDADGMRNFQKFVYFPKLLQDPSLIDIMLPKTIDEMKAEGENEQLAKDTMPPVSETDNHTTHIYTHHMVEPKTWATWNHIAWHEELLDKQKKQQQGQGQGGQNNVSESISYKDLPPEGQVQMAQQAGIKIDPQAAQSVAQQSSQNPQQNPQTQPANKVKQGKQKTNPLSMTAPLKTEMNKNLAGNLQ